MAGLANCVLLFLALSATCLNLNVCAEQDVEVPESDKEDYEDVEEEEDVSWSEGAPDVETSFLFPEHPDMKIPLGEEATVLIGFANSGDESYNVSYVNAQLHSPFDLNYYIQNFTSKGVFTTVPAHAEVTVEYKFLPDESLEALEFWLSGYILYNSSDGEPFRQIYVNSTIELVEVKKASTVFKSTMSYLFLVLLLGVGIFALLQNVAPKKVARTVERAKKAAKKAAKEAQGTADVSSEWDVSVYKPNTKSRGRSSKTKKGKKAD